MTFVSRFLCLKEGDGAAFKKNRCVCKKQRTGAELDKAAAMSAVQGYLLWGMNILLCRTAYAADILDIAKDAMQKVYSDVAGLATVGAVVCAAICLFLMNFSKSGKTVDESRAWLKRIVVCWAVLMTPGAIVIYMESIIPQQSFTP